MHQATLVEELRRLADEEEELEAACATLASLVVEGSAELGELAVEHRKSAAQLCMTRPRLRALLSTMRASLVAMVRTDRVALAWLRERERDLVRAYLRLDARPGLDESTRARLRCFLLPAAFERFTRADKLAIAAEHGSGVHA